MATITTFDHHAVFPQKGARHAAIARYRLADDLAAGVNGKRLAEEVPSQKYLSGISAELLDVSRNGKWVTYVAFPEHTLWRSKVDGSERLQLTLPPVQATAPRWSPDGKRIASFDAAPGKRWRIYLVSADGGTPEPALDEQHNEMDPNWTPDGNSLLFNYFPIFETAASEDPGVYILDLKTRKLTTLPGAKGFWVPRWSIDGRYIVARSLDCEVLMLFDSRRRRGRNWREECTSVS